MHPTDDKCFFMATLDRLSHMIPLIRADFAACGKPSDLTRPLLSAPICMLV